MFKNLRIRLARSLAPDYFSEFDNEINQRILKHVAQIDPFEFLMKEFHGIFSKEFMNPEENLDEKGKLGMMMWGFQQEGDPHFKHMTDWIMNTQGNETLKRAPVTEARILYGRAQISTILLFVKEVRRLSNLYKEKLEQNRTNNFDKNLTVE